MHATEMFALTEATIRIRFRSTVSAVCSLIVNQSKIRQTIKHINQLLFLTARVTSCCPLGIALVQLCRQRSRPVRRKLWSFVRALCTARVTTEFARLIRTTIDSVFFAETATASTIGTLSARIVCLSRVDRILGSVAIDVEIEYWFLNSTLFLLSCGRLGGGLFL